MKFPIPYLDSRAMLVLAAACWGLSTVVSKSALAQLPPLTLLVIQLTASVTFLWFLVLVQRRPVRLDAEALRLGLLGVLNPGLAYTFSLIGLTLTTASLSTLLWAAEPILILGLAWLLLREALTRPLIALSASALAGVLLVAGLRLGGGAPGAWLGNLLTLIGVGCCALYTVLARRAGTRLDPLGLVAWQQTFALAWALLIWPAERWLGPGPALDLPARAWGLALASGVSYYGLAFWFYISGLNRTSASLAGLSLNLIPLFGVGGGLVFLGERLAPAQWLGAALILASVAGTLRFHKPEIAPAP